MRNKPRNPARHLALIRWRSICDRALNRDGKHPTYARIELRFSREEFLAWAIPEFSRWLRDRPEQTACIDRSDNTGHYEIGNLRLVTLPESNRNRIHKGKPKRDPAGLHWCRECGRLLPIEQFYKGHGALCKRHDNERRLRQRRCK